VRSGEEFMISDEEFQRANERSKAIQSRGRVVSARFDAVNSKVILEFDTTATFSFPVSMAEGLSGARPADLKEIEISYTGLGLHWPRLDADLYVPSLLGGMFGSRRWMASQLGAAGGRATTEAKAAAARDNGKRGGRPPNALPVAMSPKPAHPRRGR